MKLLTSTALVLGLLFAAPMVAQAQECLTVEMIENDPQMSAGLVANVADIAGDDLAALKEIIAAEYQMAVEDLTFDRVVAYEIDGTQFPELEGFYWVVLFNEGCSINAFPEAGDVFDARLEAAGIVTE